MSRIRHWGWETLIFRAATALALVHALDDALVNRQPGVDLDHHALAAAIALAAGIAAIVAFPRLRPGFRAAVALVFGVLAATNGSMHVIHIAKDGPAHSDVTGALAIVAGLSLIGLALWIPWRHRGEGRRQRAGAGSIEPSQSWLAFSSSTQGSTRQRWRSSRRTSTGSRSPTRPAATCR